MDGSSPANGIYDFVFYLFDDPTSGSQLASIIVSDYTVTDGLLT